MFPQPHGEKIIFLEFSGSCTKIEDKKNILSIVTPSLSDILSVMMAKKIMYLYLPLLYLISRVQWEVSDEKCNFAFCNPKIACENCTIQTFALFIRSVSIFSFSLFSANMLVTKQLGKHAKIYFIFWYFCIYILLFLFLFIFFFWFMPCWYWKIYMFPCLSSRGKLAYVGCHENTQKSMKTKYTLKTMSTKGNFERLKHDDHKNLK